MLVTLEDMKIRLGIPDATTDHDDFLNSQITIISDTIEAYCLRKFEQASYTQTYYYDDFSDITPLRNLLMFHYPMISLTSIEEKDSDGVVSDTLTSSSYRVHSPSGKVKRLEGAYPSSWFSNGAYSVDMVYEAGYAYADIPKPIQEAVYGLVEERYNKDQSNVNVNFGSDVQRVSIPGAISVDFDYSLQANERTSKFGMILGNYSNVLDPYRSERAVLGEIRTNYVV